MIICCKAYFLKRIFFNFNQTVSWCGVFDDLSSVFDVVLIFWHSRILTLTWNGCFHYTLIIIWHQTCDQIMWIRWLLTSLKIDAWVSVILIFRCSPPRKNLSGILGKQGWTCCSVQRCRQRLYYSLRPKLWTKSCFMIWNEVTLTG